MDYWIEWPERATLTGKELLTQDANVTPPPPRLIPLRDRNGNVVAYALAAAVVAARLKEVP